MPVPTVEELRTTFLFKGCTDEQLQWLSTHSEVLEFAPADCILGDDQPPDALWVLLLGEVQFTRKIGGREFVTETSADPGVWGGWLPAFDDLPIQNIYTIRALQPTRMIHLGKEEVRQLFVRGFPVVSHLLAGIYGGIQNFEALARQQEKMAALGKLSAGLAHELNNPASAVQRSVEQMRELLVPQEEQSLLLGQRLPAETVSYLTTFRRDAIARQSSLPVLDPLKRSDLEDELQEWLDEHQVENSWELAPMLLDVGLRIEQLEPLRLALPEDALASALNWLASSLTILLLTKTLESSSSRISDLVKSIKAYTYMDKSALQEVDIPETLEDTLRILSYKLKKQSVTVERIYDPKLPKLMVYGSLLNQVWTNLIDNAIDALRSIPDYARHLTIRTTLDGPWAHIEIQDNGSGVPKEIQSRIFEPFFTTKPQGEGTGLGLDTSYRIIQQHHGDLSLKSLPGNTRFIVRLPLHPTH